MSFLIWPVVAGLVIYLVLRRRNLLAGNAVFIAVTAVLALLLVPLALLILFTSIPATPAGEQFRNAMHFVAPAIGAVLILVGLLLRTRRGIPSLVLGVVEVATLLSTVVPLG